MASCRTHKGWGSLRLIQPDPMPDDYADYWMVQSLTDDKLETMPKGRIRCANTLNKPEHWREDEEDRK